MSGSLIEALIIPVDSRHCGLSQNYPWIPGLPLDYPWIPEDCHKIITSSLNHIQTLKKYDDKKKECRMEKGGKW